MLILRILIVAFNVVVVTYLIWRILEVIKQPLLPWKKTVVIVGALILLFAPLGIFLKFFAPSMQYFLIYPVAISLYLYMIREL